MLTYEREAETQEEPMTLMEEIVFYFIAFGYLVMLSFLPELLRH